MARIKRTFSVPVLEHLPNGKTRRRILKREHVCTKKCLRKMRMFGLVFAYCAKYSYLDINDPRIKAERQSQR